MVGDNSRHTWFEFSSNVPECFLRLENEVNEFPFYAFIHHFPGSVDEDKKEHVHFIVRLNQPMLLKSFARKLDLPPNFIRWVRMPRSMIRYLVHIDNPEKEQYSREDIKTNDPQLVNNAFDEKKFCSPLSEYYDYCKVLNGQLPISQYLDDNSAIISSLPFSSRLKLYSTLYFADKNNQYERGNM